MRTRYVFPGWMVIKRIARYIESRIGREKNGQFIFRNGYDSAHSAMHHGNGATPITLAGNKPVAEAIKRCGAAFSGALETLPDLCFGGLHVQAVKKARVGNPACSRVGILAHGEILWRNSFRDHNRNNRKPVFPREFEVALIMCRATENGACAVAHQYEIRDIDRQFPFGIEWMAGRDAGVITTLLCRLDRFLGGAELLTLCDKPVEHRIVHTQVSRHRMFWREGNKARAEKRIRPRGEHFNRAAV